MKRIIFNNPPKDLFKQLKDAGLINYFDIKDPETHHLQGKSIWDIETEHSKNAVWGDYTTFEKYRKEAKFTEYNKLFLDENDNWISATIDLTDKGIEILKTTGLEFKVL